MISLGLLLPVDYKLASVASILELIETVNELHAARKQPAPFSLEILQFPGQINPDERKFHGYRIRSIRSRFNPDLLLLPAINTRNIEEMLDRNKEFLPYLQKQHKSGAGIASFCTGAYLFAASGLLNGRLATTHMDTCPDFIVRFPKVFVKPDRTMTIDGNCYTSGGASLAYHLLVHLVQKYCGNEMAVRISKIFTIDLNRSQQSYFSTFRPDYSHNDDMVKRIQRRIESGYPTIRTIEEITRDLPASRRNLVRRFKQATGVPPIEYLQHTRVERAKQQLELSNLDISEIIHETGYTDPKSFRKVFFKLVGMTASEYRNKLGIK